MEGLKGYDEASDIRDDLERKEICTILQHLRTFGIFYAAPLDLDYAMLQKFQAAYKHPEPGDCGPHSSDPTNTAMEEGEPGWPTGATRNALNCCVGTATCSCRARNQAPTCRRSAT
ncbi:MULTISPECIES: hypothetical protein [unclassified Streptomyces]|uniref:hypothetical protein n=1 Tax=unclassified Streptomyces TaxID=2593676 RepID=UPI002E813C4C|nr:hypothetical protein [Streptomyces sp. NBC_00562]WTC76940.1 hypothetical protein OH719_02530 [Streptomyces sp. NBC_01653]WTD93920.1 hypothetical protein OG891_44330 [Streptomyces sp. NBC_01637]WUC24943.1 hypothetical protein OHA33_42965 [Streptomyces sp. NBC_00562]